MGATALRQSRRLQARVDELEAASDKQRAEIERLEADNKKLQAQMEDAARKHRGDLLEEVTLRVAAQEQLIRDIRTPCYECGKPWRPPLQRDIGYDPFEDNEIRRLIEEGSLKPAAAPPDERTFPEPNARGARRAAIIASLERLEAAGVRRGRRP